MRYLLAILAFVLSACATNPYTERSQYLTVSLAEVEQIAAQEYNRILGESTLSRDPNEKARVKRVADRIIEAAKRSKYSELANRYKWEVAIIVDDSNINAFALPGGKIGIYTGILPVLQNDAALATVIGHEVSHALARHSGERISQINLATLGLNVAQPALVGVATDPNVTRVVMAALGLGAEYGMLLPFSRTHESEADRIGQLLAAQAGYDPREASKVWERMQRTGDVQVPQLLSTHPSHETRVTQLNEWVPEADSYYVAYRQAKRSKMILTSESQARWVLYKRSALNLKKPLSPSTRLAIIDIPRIMRESPRCKDAVSTLAQERDEQRRRVAFLGKQIEEQRANLQLFDGKEWELADRQEQLRDGISYLQRFKLSSQTHNKTMETMYWQRSNQEIAELVRKLSINRHIDLVIHNPNRWEQFTGDIGLPAEIEFYLQYGYDDLTSDVLNEFNRSSRPLL